MLACIINSHSFEISEDIIRYKKLIFDETENCATCKEFDIYFKIYYRSDGSFPGPICKDIKQLQAIHPTKTICFAILNSDFVMSFYVTGTDEETLYKNAEYVSKNVFDIEFSRYC